MLGSLPLHILAETTLAAPASSHTFTLSDYRVPGWARHLVLIINARSTEAVSRVGADLRFNGDSGANYNRQFLAGIGVTASAGVTTGGTQLRVLEVTGASAAAGVFSGGQVLIPHYAGTTNHKVVLSIAGAAEESAAIWAGRWASPSAITSLTLLPNANTFDTGSYFALAVVDERFRVAESLLASDGTFDFQNITQTPGDLAVVAYLRSDRAANEADSVVVSLNGDTASASYNRQWLNASGALVTSASAANRIVANTTADTATANAFGALAVTIPQYQNAYRKNIAAISGYHSGVGPNSGANIAASQWVNTAAVSRVTLAPSSGTNFRAGSMASLYCVPKRLIARTVLGADAASVTFSGIPQGYAGLQAGVLARTDVAAVADQVKCECNGDAAAVNYARQRLSGAGAVVSAATALDGEAGEVAGDSAAANVFGGFTLTLPQYGQTDRHKHRFGAGGQDSTSPVVSAYSNRWASTAAITGVTFKPVAGPNFRAGSVFELWGVLSAGQIAAQRRSRTMMLRRAQDGRP